MPQIEFRYSRSYDMNYRSSAFVQKYLDKQNEAYPLEKEVLSYIKKIQKLWDKDGKKILENISNLTGFKWKENKIICYVIGLGMSSFDPLTIRIFKGNLSYFIQTLTHELIHRIESENKDRYSKWQQYAKKIYQEESELTIDHILISAVHWKILESTQNKSAVKREMLRYENHPESFQAWKIVEEKTPDAIMREFKKSLRS